MGSVPADSDQARVLKTEPNNIIQNNTSDFNPKPGNWIIIVHKQNKSAAKCLTDSAPTSNLSPEKGRNSISRLTADKQIIQNADIEINPALMLITPQILEYLKE